MMSIVLAAWLGVAQAGSSQVLSINQEDHDAIIQEIQDYLNELENEMEPLPECSVSPREYWLACA